MVKPQSLAAVAVEMKTQGSRHWQCPNNLHDKSLMVLIECLVLVTHCMLIRHRLMRMPGIEILESALNSEWLIFCSDTSSTSSERSF